MRTREKVLVICPGRGTYTAAELGYLNRHRSALNEVISVIDHYRTSRGQPSISELDLAKTYSASLHATAAHAPALIYGCAIADFHSLDPEKYEVVAVTGNSMGWYIALAAAGALSPEAAIHLINTMGNLTGGNGLGGQLIYPCFDEQWRPDPEKTALVNRLMSDVNSQGDGAQVFDSIYLGGFRVIAGNDEGIRTLMKRLPPLENRYPMKLMNHSAFHTPLMAEASRQAFETLGNENLFQKPNVPLIDGEGHIWQPYSTDLEELMDYTLGRQVTEPYDFTLAIKTAIREFAPTKLVLLGPGSNLGGSIGQTLVEMKWKGIHSKTAFTDLQERDPYLLSLGRLAQNT
jgi:[acyl-carrier-protein] S-malonyltransferase